MDIAYSLPLPIQLWLYELKYQLLNETNVYYMFALYINFEAYN